MTGSQLGSEVACFFFFFHWGKHLHTNKLTVSSRILGCFSPTLETLFTTDLSFSRTVLRLLWKSTRQVFWINTYINCSVKTIESFYLNLNCSFYNFWLCVTKVISKDHGSLCWLQAKSTGFFERLDVTLLRQGW